MGQYYFRKTNIWASMTEARQNVKSSMRLNSCKHNLLLILLVEFKIIRLVSIILGKLTYGLV